MMSNARWFQILGFAGLVGMPACSDMEAPHVRNGRQDASASFDAGSTERRSGALETGSAPELDPTTTLSAEISCGEDSEPVAWNAGEPPASLVLEATKTYGPSTWFHDDRSLDEPISFSIPSELPVTVGNAGNHQASLRFRLGDGEQVRCDYRGGSSQAHPVGPEVETGLRYVFDGCDDGSPAGELVEADQFRLSIANGDSWSPSRESPQTTVQAELRPASRWVVPPALRVAGGSSTGASAELRFGNGPNDAGATTCAYVESETEGFLRLESCSEPTLGAGTIVVAPWASLRVEDGACAPGETTRVEARMLPPADESAETTVALRLTPPTVSLTEVGETRRVAVRGFVDGREVDVTSLDVEVERFGEDIEIERLPDSSVRVTALALPGHGAFGVRTRTSESPATSGALVVTAPLREHVVELRAADMALPSVGIHPFDPSPGAADAVEAGGIGSFSFEELVPEESQTEIVRLVAVVRAESSSLVPGDVFALTDGDGLQGIVLSTETRGAFTRIEYMPLSVAHVFAAMDVDYHGELAVAGYTWDAMTASEMDAAREEKVDVDAVSDGATLQRGTLDQLRAAGVRSASTRPESPRLGVEGVQNEALLDRLAASCSGDLSGNLLALKLERGLKFFPLGDDFVLRYDFDTPEREDPRAGILAPLLPGMPVNELLAFRLEELSARAAFRLEYFAAIDARLRSDVTYGGTCDVNELLGGNFVSNVSQFSISLPLGLVVRGEVDPQLAFDVEANGGPTVAFRYSFSEQRDWDMGFQLGEDIPGGLRPHPAIRDLNEDGSLGYLESLSRPRENAEPPILSADWGGLFTDTEPVFSIQAEAGVDMPFQLALTFGPGILAVNALDRLAERGAELDQAERLRLIERANRATSALAALFAGGIISAEAGVGIFARFGIESSGSLLNTSFDNTTYLCHTMNRLGVQTDFTAVSVSVLAGLTDALELLTVVPLLDLDLTLFSVDMPPISALSFYNCQNPAMGFDPRGYVRRDSRRCGEPLEPGETATLFVEAFSQDDELDVLLASDATHDEAGVYLDGLAGMATGAWTRIDGGAVPRVSTSGRVHTYRGEFPLDSEAAEALSGHGEVRMLTRGSMLGVVPMHDQLASFAPACGCSTDDDCDGGTCDIDATNEVVGTCTLESFVVFQANGLTFRPPGTNQAVVGTGCEASVARNVSLRGVADTAVLQDGSGRIIEEAELFLDGSMIAEERAVDDSQVTLTAAPIDLTEGSHELTLVIRGTGANGLAWEETFEGSFPVRIDVEDCDCPANPCEAFNAECGTLDTPCGTFECGGECRCVANTCAGGPGDGRGQPPPECIPGTCGPDDVGLISDGCGGTLDCGAPPPCQPAICDPTACGPVPDGCGGTLDCGDCCGGATTRTCASGSLWENPLTGDWECRRSFQACMEVNLVYDASRYGEPNERGYVCAASCGAFGYCGDGIREVGLPGSLIELPTIASEANLAACSCKTCEDITDEDRDGFDDGGTFGAIRGYLANDAETPTGIDELEYRNSSLPGTYDLESVCGACAWSNYYYTSTAASSIYWCDPDAVTAPDPCPSGFVACGEQCVAPGCCDL